jgi:hypothetical protein
METIMRRNSGAPSSERGERKKERGRGKRVGGDEEIRSGEVHVDTGICNRQLGLLSATRKHLGPEINYSGGGRVPTRLLFDRNACLFWKFSFAQMEYLSGFS